MTQQGYINQASHNQKFIELLESQQTIDFPDWIITGIFYKSLHWLNAWLISQGRSSSDFDTHGKMRDVIDYRPRRNRPASACPVDRATYSAYGDLYEYSIQSRYNGFLTEEAMKKLNQANLIESRKGSDIIKKFVESRGILLNSAPATSVIPVEKSSIDEQAANAR